MSKPAIVKQVTIKLFFNLSNRSFYVQIGGKIFLINDKVAGAIQEGENLEIRHAKDLKDIQEISLGDEK